MEPNDYCPPVDQALLKWLEKTFPNNLPTDMGISVDTIRYRQGQVSVIARLRSEYNRQNEKPEQE